MFEPETHRADLSLSPKGRFSIRPKPGGKMLCLQRRTIIRLTTIVLCLSTVVSFASEVCRLHRLAPFSDSYDRAVSVLPKATTSNPHKAVIYIEKTDLGIYYQSNYITPGFKYPTKIGSSRATNADTAFINI